MKEIVEKYIEMEKMRYLKMTILTLALFSVSLLISILEFKEVVPFVLTVYILLILFFLYKYLTFPLFVYNILSRITFSNFEEFVERYCDEVLKEEKKKNKLNIAIFITVNLVVFVLGLKILLLIILFPWFLYILISFLSLERLKKVIKERFYKIKDLSERGLI